MQDMEEFFRSGATRSYAFRRTSLEKLRDVIRAKEKMIFDALHTDLGKSAEETWVTENGMVIAELKYMLRNLRKWMKPERKKTNLVNFPSRSSVRREPLGLVLIIGPWNYPFQLLLNPLCGAIAAGNCVVLKPSEFTPATNEVVRQIIAECFDPLHVRMVEGPGSEVIPPLLSSCRFDHIFFTGSTAVGKEIYRMAADRLVPVTLELGGKSPCVVEEDANIGVAARRIAITKFSNAGQMCVAPDYILVHESRKAELLKKLQEAMQRFFGDDPKASYSYARMINRKQLDRVAAYITAAGIVVGGETDIDNLFIAPTIVAEPATGSALMKEEIFGPILPVIGFSDREKALSQIREHADPLAFYLYTSSAQHEQFWLDRVPAGGTCINNSAWHLTNHYLPFGGRGMSGIGRYHGKYSFDTFSHLRAVMKTPTWFDPWLKYPPFEGKLKWYKKFTGK